jgi:hypothetical protein
MFSAATIQNSDQSVENLPECKKLPAIKIGQKNAKNFM